LDAIIADFHDFCASHGTASEADTRVKLIDRILKEVCGWPETELSREDHSESGFSDYIRRFPIGNAAREEVILGRTSLGSSNAVCQGSGVRTESQRWPIILRWTNGSS
jgi:hypothetical protein